MKRVIGIMLVLVLLGSLAYMAFGCECGVEAGVGTLEIRVTDAPPDYDIVSINVTFSTIDIHKAGDEEGEWLSIEITGEDTFDLLQLQASNLKALLAEAEVDVGEYTQVRLTLGTVDIVMGDGSEPPEFVLPGGELKFVHPFEILDGETTILLLDFDAEESIVETGAGKIIFKPVVKLIIEQGGDEPVTTTVTTTEAE